MKVEKKNTSQCVIELTVNADGAEVKSAYEKVVSAFVREGQIPGFRKGKVPRAVVLQKFDSEIREEAKRACVSELYPKALEEAKITPFNLDGAKDITFSPETGITFTMILEVAPEVKLPKYKKLAIKAGDTTVPEEDVSKQIEQMRKSMAKYEEAKDGVICEGDFVSIDYAGTVSKKPMAEVLPEMKAITGQQGFWLQVEEGRFLPEILEALKGMAIGETKKVDVKFPKENAPEAIKGKKCSYEIKVNMYRRRVLPEDAELIANAKVESMEKLRADVRERLEKATANAELENRRTQAIELLLKKADFDVPPVLVQNQTQNYLQDLARRAQYSNLPSDYFEKNREKILADANDFATKQVRLSYILAEIAKAEKIEATAADVDERIAKMTEVRVARGEKDLTAAAVKAELAKDGALDGISEQIVAEKALDLVLKEAK